MTTGTGASSSPRQPETSWAEKLFQRSALKQRKLLEIERRLGVERVGLRCLDLGSDNGVISLRLRRGGGNWASGDLTPEAVASIRGLVETDVHPIHPSRLPFADGEFDRVVVVDMLEHVPDEAAFCAELGRITRPGGLLIVNTPHLKRTALKRLRQALGQTDQKHGHLRPGYTPERLSELLGSHFTPREHRTYSRFFSELVDTAIQWGVEALGKQSSPKGIVVTGQDLARHQKMFRAYSLVYPLVWAISRLDALVPASGYMLIQTFQRR